MTLHEYISRTMCEVMIQDLLRLDIPAFPENHIQLIAEYLASLGWCKEG